MKKILWSGAKMAHKNKSIISMPYIRPMYNLTFDIDLERMYDVFFR